MNYSSVVSLSSPRDFETVSTLQEQDIWDSEQRDQKRQQIRHW